MPDSIVPDPLASDSQLRWLYLGRNPDKPSETLWADDDRVRLAREEVRLWHEAHYDSERDVVEEKRTESLSQLLQRADDQWSQRDPEGYQEAHGGVTKMSLEQYAEDSNPAANPAHKSLAEELIRLTKIGSPYWQPAHKDHKAYLARATWLYERIFDSQP